MKCRLFALHKYRLLQRGRRLHLSLIHICTAALVFYYQDVVINYASTCLSKLIKSETHTIL